MLDTERQRLAEVVWRIAHFMLGTIDMDPAERERRVVAMLDGLDDRQQQVAVMGAKIVLDRLAEDASEANKAALGLIMAADPLTPTRQ
ncbi:hypothetical protein CCR97_10205 [Rhodoplanes elegans]|uniref:Uncharacterized protein n=1 Tax=Rhodoplanes elegans TaxID=29408 RepID=A0A327KNQ6_9BRAD|nr:hypothetical protein [Rhodoplanes elegans]MBK5958578.1 hypothetical protein [Rhodoplanes elegans]RAI40529.1 hypothetical protein CH338_05955 [Rhodoplanes elegans]